MTSRAPGEEGTLPKANDDLIVVIPGILGSVLERDGREFWNHSLAAMRRGLPPRRLARALSFDAPGTVSATGLIDGLHVIPGLWGIDGYRTLLDRMAQAGEILAFPYDWRLSNAVNAARLKEAVERRLRPGQKAAFVCHSMGGLLARYYLEVLGGRETARCLITLGTPHQGAAKAAAVLALGLAPSMRARLGPGGTVLDDLHTVLSTFPSVYELLPTYRSIDLGGGRMATLSEASLPGIDGPSAREAAVFHRRIADAVASNAPTPYRTYMFGGHRHPTVLSLRHDAAGIEPLATWRGEALHGDGTVPRFSAVTPESEDDTAVRYSGERHSALAGARHVTDALQALLTAQPVRRYQASESDLSVDLPELAPVGGTLRIAVMSQLDRLALVITAIHDGTRQIIRVPILRNRGGGRYNGDLVLTHPGAWRVTVAPVTPAPVSPVTEIVIAAGPEAS